jgi:hypothetical protein
MPRRRDYAREYQERLRRGREANLPTPVARGHGPVPMATARRLEAERRGGKKLPSRTVREHRKGIAQYEKRYWGQLVAGKGGVRRIPRNFASREQALRTLREQGYPRELVTSDDYITIRQEPNGRWVIYVTS